MIPAELVTQIVSQGLVGVFLLLYMLGFIFSKAAVKDRLSEQAASYEAQLAQERRIGEIHLRAAETERERATAAERALEGQVEQGRLALSLLSAMKDSLGSKESP